MNWSAWKFAIGWPKALGGSDRFSDFLDPVIYHAVDVPGAGEGAEGHAVEYLLMAASVLIALLGIWFAIRWFLKQPEVPERLAAKYPGLYRLLYRKYYVDEIYDALFVNRTKDLGIALGAFDRNVIDGLGVNGAGWLTRLISTISMAWDKWVVDGLVNLSAWIVRAAGGAMRYLQTGLFSTYAIMIVMGVIALLSYYLHLIRTPVH